MDKPKIPAYIGTAFEKLNKAGYEAYIVGGCVRDFLMGKLPDDYDMTTSAEPWQTEECFRGFRTIETGMKHGTVTVVIDGENVEITTFRCDGKYTDRRRPENVFFTKNLKDDLARRDFTMNAIAYNPDSGFTDIYGGAEDIKNSLIRCVGNADIRFNEDGLRIMRALRFSSVLGFGIEEETAVSIRKNKNLLQYISSERIFTEMKKLLAGKNAPGVLREFREVFCEIFPGLNPQENIFPYADRIPESRNEYVRFALFLYPADGDSVLAVCKNLKTDNKFMKFCTFLSEYNDKEFTKISSVRRLAGEYGYEKANALAEMKKLTAKPDAEFFAQTLAETENSRQCVSLKDLAISGRELNEINISGIMTGKILNALLAEVMEGKTANEKSALLARARELCVSED